ncbi:hypothetical protein ACO0LB_06155 [Undibacterium sp. SXout7W]|uniref:hypothetical protein n=1 Tax=Undibacterium sp. SXout7W TaxID=3413049 RepID=UPI003BF383EE
MMPIPTVSKEELERVHRALRISIPLECASPLILATLAAIAHCWRGRVPAHLWGRPVPSPLSPKASVPDFKRRAAGDFE